MADRILPTAEELRAVLTYDQFSGIFTWLVTNSNRAVAGKSAGGLNPDGYITIRVNRIGVPAHRLAWCWMTGEWPEMQIDHKDGIRSNNRWLNLRLATTEQNLHNSRPYPNSLSPLKGVTHDKAKGKWMARIRCNYKRLYLGRFDTAEEAHDAYASKATELYGEFARVE